MHNNYELYKLLLLISWLRFHQIINKISANGIEKQCTDSISTIIIISTLHVAY